MNIIKKVQNKLTYLKSERYVKQKQRELQQVISRNRECKLNCVKLQ